MTAGVLGRHGSGRRPGPVFFQASSLPWLVPLVAGLALLVPGAQARLEVGRVHLPDAPWRLLTAHLAHYSFEHWLLDALTFLALGSACVRRAARRTYATLLVAALAIPAGVLLLQPEIRCYRGLSGLDSALFGLLLALTLRSGRSGQALLAGALFMAKLAFELTTGRSVFYDPSDSGFTPLPLAHALGALAGLAVGAWPSATGVRGARLSARWKPLRRVSQSARRRAPPHPDGSSACSR